MLPQRAFSPIIIAEDLYLQTFVRIPLLGGFEIPDSKPPFSIQMRRTSIALSWPPGFSGILICVQIYLFLFHYGMERFYVGILYRFYGQICRHGCVIGIPDNLAAAQVHHGSQISPAFFQHLDVGNICTPFLINGFCLKITFQDIYFIIWDSSAVCMVVIFFYHDRP